jgi:hypothetical protein
MPILPTEAADIAKAHGLTLSDARALAVMADTIEHAEELAAKFTPEEYGEVRGVEIATEILDGRR